MNTATTANTMTNELSATATTANDNDGTLSITNYRELIQQQMWHNIQRTNNTATASTATLTATAATPLDANVDDEMVLGTAALIAVFIAAVQELLQPMAAL
ncbi:hypothetical protein GQ42DRAFT_165916, partial [Ramicandelaber brevisporus]